ncbi:WD40 repeat-like protein [Favolaschia claudopus]|uniref:WD40 repeat-like protein n=1 Tax=Favolaschia claudopus TaxID=2862362 RepID=A0AAW0E8G7_9AGAR
MPKATKNLALDSCRALAERTNLPTSNASPSLKAWLAQPRKRAHCEASSENDDLGCRKRVKLSPSPTDSDAYESDNSDLDLNSRQVNQHRRRNRTPWDVATHMTPVSSCRRSFLSTLPILQSFVSSNKVDVFRCHSVLEGSFMAPPYACSYSHSAQTSGQPLLAVATEQGTVYILNTSKRKEWDPEPSHNVLQPHNNGVFDIKWNLTDRLLATSSGDRSTRISDVETRQTIHSLRGHEGTVKCISWDPTHPDILSTGGRDGLICIWDLRVSGNLSEGTATLGPVTRIYAAHEEVGPNGKRKTGKRKNAPVPKSVTGLLYSDTDPHYLISSGSADGILRCWDVRFTKKSKVKEPACLQSSPLDPTLSPGASRSRGIISLTQGTGPTLGLLFGLSADSRIHTYERDSLTAFGNTYTHANLQTNFYVKIATSPCGRWLASGGAGPSGSSFMFDVSNATRSAAEYKGVELKGHAGDAGAVDWASDMLATCWDDGMVRVWRPESEIYRACAENAEERRWNWCWASV